MRVSLTGILQFAIAHTQLDRPGAHCEHFRRRRARRIHDRDSHRDFRDSAVVGIEQRGGDAGRPESGREAAGARRESRVAHRTLQHAFPGHRWECVFIFFAEPIVRLFTHDPAVVPLGAACLRIVSYGNIGYAYGMVMLQAFNGAGDTVTPTIVNFFGFWLFEIPLAYWLAIPLHMRSNGVFFSIAIAESSMAVASTILFKQGKWKKQKI